MAIRPVGNRILIEPKVQEEKTKSGIIIPESAKENPNQGIVIEVGNGKEAAESGIKKGSKVIFTRFGHTEVKDNTKKLLLVEVKDILAIID